MITQSRFKQREQKGRLNWNMDRILLDSNWNRLKNRWSNKTTFCHRRTHFYKSRIRFLIDFLQIKVHLKWWKSYKFNRTTNKLGHRLLKVIDARMMTLFMIRSILLSWPSKSLISWKAKRSKSYRKISCKQWINSKRCLSWRHNNWTRIWWRWAVKLPKW